MNIGNRIKNRRIELGLSVDEVAERLGKNRATVYRYENNDIENLPTTVLEPLARILGTTPAFLMGWEDSIEYETVDEDDYKTLRMVFDRFHYSLQKLDEDNYTLQHKKEKDFIVVISSYDLNTILYDISDYIGFLIGKQFEKMLDKLRKNNISDDIDENLPFN